MSNVQFLRNELVILEQAFSASWPGSPLRDSLASDIMQLRRDLAIAEPEQSIPSKQAA